MQHFNGVWVLVGLDERYTIQLIILLPLHALANCSCCFFCHLFLAIAAKIHKVNVVHNGMSNLVQQACLNHQATTVTTMVILIIITALNLSEKDHSIK
jgi:hypothetical protein